MAVLEMASGQGVPDDFVHRQVNDRGHPPPGDPGPPYTTTRRYQAPTVRDLVGCLASRQAPLGRSDARP
jgi:hypothetical protein